jgi:hypothetical protein
MSLKCLDMKCFLIFALLLVYTCTSAQVVRKPYKSNQTNNGNQVAPDRTVSAGSYAIAPDNMPCVVPDMSKVTRMPNSFKTGDSIPFMPNGFRRTPIVMVKTTNTPNKSPK